MTGADDGANRGSPATMEYHFLSTAPRDASATVIFFVADVMFEQPHREVFRRT